MAGQDDRNMKMQITFLENMHKIFCGRMSSAEFWKFYTLIMEYCVKNKEVAVWITDRIEVAACEYQLLHEKIKEFLDDFMMEISKNIPEDAEEEENMMYYCNVWDKYRMSSRMLNSASSYLNKQYHKKYADADNVQTIALKAWRKHLFNHLNYKIANSALRMLERSRRGGDIKESCIKAVVTSYLELGVLDVPRDSDDSATSHLSAYRMFEESVLNGTRDFYHSEIESKRNDKNFVDFIAYMHYAKSRIEEEMKIRAHLLHFTTHQRLLNVICDIFIKDRIDAFCEEFKELLRKNDSKNLVLICALAVNSPVVLYQLVEIFQEFVCQDGLHMINSSVEEATNNAKTYTDILLFVYKKYKKMTNEEFRIAPQFKTALDKACLSFINNNAVIKNCGEISKGSELLAIYCHKLLIKTKHNENEIIEESLNDIMDIFQYIQDKDVFEMYYKKHLAERLVDQTSSSDGAEELMISRMKLCCGNSYTHKLQRMYQDAEVSKNLCDEFRHSTSNSDIPNFDFRIQVLTHGYWPFIQSVSVTPPLEIVKTMDAFKAFYNSKQNGRKLSWLFDRSKGELIMHANKQRYIIRANTFQMSILMLFNDKLSYTVKEINENTGLEIKYVIQILALLGGKFKIFKCAPKTDMTEESIVQLNTEFKAPKTRLDLSVYRLKLMEESERNKIRSDIEEDRRHVINAAIVRVMKARKTLSHQNLIVEVLSQLAKFKPKIPVIKKCIDTLIEKEYLERNGIDAYNYLA